MVNGGCDKRKVDVSRIMPSIDDEQDYNIWIWLIGDLHCGKTATALSFVDGLSFFFLKFEGDATNRAFLYSLH